MRIFEGFRPWRVKDDPSGREAISGLTSYLQSSAISGKWGRYYFGERHENPVPDLVTQFQETAGDLKKNPALVRFALETVSCLQRAYGKKHKNDPEKIRKLDEINGLHRYLSALLPEEALPEKQDLPEKHRKILDIVTEETGQTKFRLIGTPWDFTKGWFREIYDHAREKPEWAVGSFLAFGGALALVKRTPSTYIDPLGMQLGNLGAGEFGTEYQFGMTAEVPLAIGRECHWDLAVLQHCGRLKTLAQDATASLDKFSSSLTSVYDGYNTRLDYVIKDPALDIGGKLAVVSNEFSEGFNDGANAAAQFVYDFGWMENSIHVVILKVSFDKARKLGQAGWDEAREGWQRFQNFFHRTAANTPLSYILGSMAVTQSYITHAGYNPEMIWTGLGGAIAGKIVHRAYSKLFNAKARAEEIIDQGREATRGFGNLQPAYIVAVDAQDEKGSSSKKIAKTAAAVAGSGLALAGVIKLTQEFPRAAGKVAGAGTVGLSWLGWQLPEDIAFHTVFGVLGASTGLTTGVYERRREKKKEARLLLQTDATLGPGGPR